MDPVRIGLLVVALPAALAIGVGLVARRWRHRGAVALAAAGVAGAIATSGALELWPLVVTDRFAHLLIAGMIAALVGLSGRGGQITTAALAAASVAAVVGPSARLAGLAAIAGAVVAGLALIAIGAGVSRAARRGDRVGLVFAGLAIAAASAAAGLSGSVVIAQLGGAVAAGVGGLWLVSLRHPGNLATSAAPVVAIATWSVIALATLYASMSALTAALLIAAGAAALAPLRRALPALALAGALAAGAAAASIAPAVSDDSGDDYDYGYGYE